MTPAPDYPNQPVAHPHADCTSSAVAPVIDGLVAGYETARTFYALSGQGDYRGLPIDRDTDAALGAAFAGLFLGSMIYGSVNVSRCKRLKRGPDGDEAPVGITREAPEEAPVPAKTSVDSAWDSQAEPAAPPAPSPTAVDRTWDATPAEPSAPTPAPTRPPASAPAPPPASSESPVEPSPEPRAPAARPER